MSERAIQIQVNERPVTLHQDRATGLQIKEAAIAQGVPIELDFILSEELGNRRSRVVGNQESVELKENEKFIAVTPDDHS